MKTPQELINQWFAYKGKKFFSGFKGNLLLLRWLLLVILTCYMIYINHERSVENAKLLITVLLFFGASNVALTTLPEMYFLKNWFKMAIFCVDTVFISFFIYWSASLDTDLYLVYFLVVFMAGLGLRVRETIIVAGVGTFLYFFLLMHSSDEFDPRLLETAFLIRIPFIFGITLFYSYLSEEARRSQAKTQEEERQNQVLTYDLHVTRNQLSHERKLATLGGMLAGMAQSMQNTLAVINEEAEFIKGLSPKNQDIRNSTDKIIRENRHSLGLINRTLHLAEGEKSVYFPLEINALLVHAVDIASYTLKVNQISLKLNLGSSLPLVTGDEAQLQQVFVYLILFATQSMAGYRGRGELTITSLELTDSRDRKKVRVLIKDDGPGISEEMREKIFEADLEGQDGDKDNLGLGISREIIEIHRGYIMLDSVPGSGNTFVLDLPAVTEGQGLKTWVKQFGEEDPGQGKKKQKPRRNSLEPV